MQRLWTFVLALQTAASWRIAATGKLISLHRLKRRVFLCRLASVR